MQKIAKGVAEPTTVAVDDETPHGLHSVCKRSIRRNTCLRLEEPSGELPDAPLSNPVVDTISEHAIDDVQVLGVFRALESKSRNILMYVCHRLLLAQKAQPDSVPEGLHTIHAGRLAVHR